MAICGQEDTHKTPASPFYAIGTGKWAARIIISECEHEWAFYNGFTEAYKYCIKCDKKENK